MKKFRFSLAKLKRYKEQILEAEKNALGILRKELNDLNAELDALIRLIDMKSDELEYIMIRGVTTADLSSRKRFITVKQQEAHEKKRQIALKEAEIERQLNVVIEATREVGTLEKLEERQLEEYRYAESKEQELFIEEFVSNIGQRKAVGG
ncbi:MAG: flagellar FliJ family protein [Oscillospiraceae bacterium]|jgi:flagellar FliJ protein|nr:flagellar FliJ family protein [Oscillospiraceae bacterium]